MVVVMIWFVRFKLIMLWLSLMILVVVMLVLIVVSIWCQEMWRLCVCCGWPSERWCVDVVFVVDLVAFDVVMVVTCVGCDGVSYGEVLVVLVLVAGWSGGGVVMIFGCDYVEDAMVDVLMLWLLLCGVLAL